MRPTRGSTRSALLVSVLLLALAGRAAPAAAQGIPGQVVSGPDGTLYLVTDSGRYTLVPGAVSEADLAGLPDLGTVSGELPAPGGAPPAASAEPGAVLAPEPESAESGEPTEAAPPEAGPPESVAEPGPGPAEGPISLDGQNTLVSRPFNLAGGNYAVTWTAQTSNPECAFSAILHASEDGRPVQPLGGGQVFGGRGSGQASLHDLPGASYYVDAIATCRWTITITPAQ